MNLFPDASWAARGTAAIVAFAVSLVSSYFLLRRRGAVQVYGSPEDSVWAGLPYLLGLSLGLAMSALLGSSEFLRGDRFYSAPQARSVGAALVLALWLLQAAALLPRANKASPPGGNLRDDNLRRGSAVWIWGLRRVLEFAAVLLVVAAGVRFNIVGLGAGSDIGLGGWSIPLTIAWLLVATYAVRLLDGLDGATPILLLTAAIAVLIGTRGANEFLLMTVCVCVTGAVLGCLRFHFYPARVPLRGPSTALLGFTFAVLTVMARQKTVAALLLIFPLAVVLLLLGGSMLGFLERILELPEKERQRREGGEERP